MSSDGEQLANAMEMYEIMSGQHMGRFYEFHDKLMCQVLPNPIH